MNFARFNTIVARSIRFVVIAFVCTLLFVSNALPAAAIGSTPSKPSEGSVRLDEVQRKSEEVTKADPMNLEETQREANRGINEVQGDADKDQMYRPENSRQATSAAEQVRDALENVTGRK
ncbi:MAG: hypothetical protein HC769_03085 [Cyanobacteria bacterium CRU_2_1]|nr:hypothetical protein [Cyanobacteria bacterium RU_5_0]NJR57919.1 hypothetical protein [Cyanobacteria bacterium CRU_2_1]